MLSPQPLPLLGTARLLDGSEAGPELSARRRERGGEEAGMGSEIDSGVRRRAARRDRDAAGGPVID